MELERVAQEAIKDFLEHISISRWERLTEPITWSESINSKEIQFEVLVLENTDEYIHVSVSVIYPLDVLSLTDISSNCVNYSSSFIINKNSS